MFNITILRSDHIRGLVIILFISIFILVPVVAESDFTLSPVKGQLSSPYEISNLTFCGESCNYAVGSPDGTEIALSCMEWKEPCSCSYSCLGCAEDDPHLFLMKSDGSGKHQISDLTVSGVPLWSPKGDAIAVKGFQKSGTPVGGFYPSNEGIWIIPVDADDGYLLVNSSDAWAAAWSPDGLFLAYILYNEENITVNIIAADKSSKSQIYTLPNSDGFEMYPNSICSIRKAGLEDTIRWSDDGESLFFISGEDLEGGLGQFLLVDVGIDGSVISRVPVNMSNSYRISEFAWKPSSDQFAYISNLTYFPTENHLLFVGSAGETEAPMYYSNYFSSYTYTSLQWSNAIDGFIFTDQGDIWKSDESGNELTRLTMNGSIRFITQLPGSEKIIYSESLNITDCTEPALGYEIVGWPNRRTYWRYWMTASRIGILDLGNMTGSPINTTLFENLPAILVAGACCDWA
jgi:Tol biopolymer transport system component